MGVVPLDERYAVALHILDRASPSVLTKERPDGGIY